MAASPAPRPPERPLGVRVPRAGSCAPPAVEPVPVFPAAACSQRCVPRVAARSASRASPAVREALQCHRSSVAARSAVRDTVSSGWGGGGQAAGLDKAALLVRVSAGNPRPNVMLLKPGGVFQSFQLPPLSFPCSAASTGSLRGLVSAGHSGEETVGPLGRDRGGSRAQQGHTYPGSKGARSPLLASPLPRPPPPFPSACPGPRGSWRSRHGALC